MQKDITDANAPGRPIQPAVDSGDSAQGLHLREVDSVAAINVARATSARVDRRHPQVLVDLPRRGSSLGISSLILGILAFLICWIPFVNLLGVPLSALGLLLGVIGFFIAVARNGSSIGFPIAGTAVSALSLVVALLITQAFVSGLKKAADNIALPSKIAAPIAAKPPAEFLVTVAPDEPVSDSVARMVAEAKKEADLHPREPEASKVPVYLPIGTSAQMGNFEVAVTGARIGVVKSQDGRTQLKRPALVIRIRVTNTTDARKLDYRSPSGRMDFSKNDIRLVDDVGNTYSRVSLGFERIAESSDESSLYPGKSTDDAIAFEEPVEKAKYLRLDLPTIPMGGDGIFHAEIPMSDIKRF